MVAGADMNQSEALSFVATPTKGHVSAFLMRPPEARQLLVFGHGAGAGMRHRFMEAMSMRLGAAGIATFRYQFPYMEAGGRRPGRAPNSARGGARRGRCRARVARPICRCSPAASRWAGG